MLFSNRNILTDDDVNFLKAKISSSVEVFFDALNFVMPPKTITTYLNRNI